MSFPRERTNSEPIQYAVESARRKAAADEPKRRRPKALFVVHGMGQQMRFDTIDMLVRGMGRAGIAIKRQGGRTVRLDGKDPVQRAELAYDTSEGEAELHVYEGYWAPLTEGQVTARNVLSFLTSAAWNGVRKGRHKFHRWLFQSPEEYVIPGSTVLEVALAVLVLGALAVVNMVAAGVLVGSAWSGGAHVLLLRDAQAVLTMMVVNLLALAAAIFVCLGLSRWLRRARWLAHALSAVGFVTLFGACATMVAGALLILAAVAHRAGGEDVGRLLESLDGSSYGSVFAIVGIVGVLAGMAASRILRGGRWLSALLGGLGAVSIILAVLIGTVTGYRSLVTCSGGVPLLPPAGETLRIECGDAPAGKDAEGSVMSLWDQWFDPRRLEDTMRDRLLGRGFEVPLLLALLFVFATACFYSQQRLRRRPGAEGAKIHASVLEICGVALAALSSPLIVYWISQAVYRWFLDGSVEIWPDNNLTLLVPFLILLAASWWIKGFIVQFVGDVAAYVASFRLDRFNKLRREIQETCASVARTIYGLCKDGEPLYESVAFVGHSLGSVVAYDTLNRMLLESKLDEQRRLQEDSQDKQQDDAQRKPHLESPVVREVADRTHLLLTFGSPLNKVTYLFSAFSSAVVDRDADGAKAGQAERNAAKGSLREKLASSLQPLIDDPACRQQLHWVNVWSPNDIISGRLEYFDPLRGPAPGTRPVCNEVDEDAVVPLAAHTAYWETTAIYGHLTDWLGALKRSPTAAPAAVRSPAATPVAASHP